MFIPVNQVADWRDLQNKVCQLFKEMAYEAETTKTVELAGRGSKEIDVYVTRLWPFLAIPETRKNGS